LNGVTNSKCSFYLIRDNKKYVYNKKILGIFLKNDFVEKKLSLEAFIRKSKFFANFYSIRSFLYVKITKFKRHGDLSKVNI